MIPSELTVSIEKYLDGSATPEERQQVLQWYRSVDHREISISLDHAEEIDGIRDRIEATLLAHIAATRPVRRLAPVYRWCAAVAVLMLLAGAWLLYRQHAVSPVVVPATVAAKPLNDALPGHNGAVLTLADGSHKVLDSLPAGVVAVQGSTTVTLRDGKLAYASGNTKTTALTYNTMSTPRGRQYQLVLPDGTAVWLNAASSITYPTAFAGEERSVTLTGEAYFEVKHSVMPFRVHAGRQVIEDLGTEFNVNAYGDESVITTTLVQGSVRVDRQMLQPGQQAIQEATGNVTVSEADVARATAWKNGIFSFHNATLPEVLRELSRWYDVDVEYEGPVTKKVFSGEIGCTLTLSQLLRILTRSDIHYRIEGGSKLIILSGS